MLAAIEAVDFRAPAAADVILAFCGVGAEGDMPQAYAAVRGAVLIGADCDPALLFAGNSGRGGRLWRMTSGGRTATEYAENREVSLQRFRVSRGSADKELASIENDLVPQAQQDRDALPAYKVV